ncbi:hypothetical protein [Saccharospirillum alexandrii]|uniref:DUF7079 family protein n=1 Tax=Saccharospirillum alexandrii TaxID=2448477 RepID=UPI003735ED84
MFLDTEIDEVNFKHIARTIDDSGFTLEQTEAILWYEVYPALESNLRSPAGVWSGWSDEWLAKTIGSTPRSKAVKGNRSVVKEIKRCWCEVCGYSERGAK